ncbi:MAG TPA: hypothetical protein VGR85_12470 [Candidatus Limnocylindria bacterium]|jgi:hypothetical protein|nr:hypothetical protein [Candidatus Limnocylindria bacterium]
MAVRAELIIFVVALALSALAFAFVMPRLTFRWRIPFAAACCAIAGLAPLLMYVALEPERAAGRALWEWSAVGGPTIQASYRLDGLAAIGLAIGALYVAAALVATTRVSARHQLLRPVILLNGLVFITLAVTDDLIADIVILGALAALTSFIAVLVSPAAAVARITGYLAGGVQGFVVAALLLSRFGGASFRFDTISPEAATPGVIVAASLGAALFAGLYPFVPWGYRNEEAGERESLRGLLTMPAGFGATLVLSRILGVTRIDLATLGLPAIDSPALIAVVVAALALRFIARRGKPGLRRRIAISVLVLVFILAYPFIHWSHLILVASLLTIAYAAAVSLALPEQWAISHYDVVLAALWIALATGSSTAFAGALVVLAGGGLAAVSDGFWMPPHRSYITAMASSTVIVAGALTIGFGAVDTPDLVTLVLALIATGAVIGLELAHAGRRLSIAAVPSDLDVSASITSFLSAVMVLLALSLPLFDAMAEAFGRPNTRRLDDFVTLVPVVAVVGTLLVVTARAVRVVLPELTALSTRLERVVSAADPVPIASASFRALAGSATTASAVFALFEERAGVWLALLLIATLLIWAVR